MPTIAAHAAVRWSRALAVSLFGGVVVLAALNPATAPVDAQAGGMQCPVVWVDNPNPGDFLVAGGYRVSGVAYDPAAAQAPGVTRVDFFLGARDDGGFFLGSLAPGPNATGDVARFEGELSVPKVTHARALVDFVAYAYDAATSGQTSFVVPVAVGVATTPTPTTFGPPLAVPAVRITSNCASTPAQATAVVPQAALIAATPTPGPQLAGTPQSGSGGPLAAQGGPIFELSNPNRGDLLLVGGYVVSGIAYDPASAQGPGVDRVQFFLDPRDQGGLLLGTASPRAAASGLAPTFATEIVIPSSAPKGSHVFMAYAHSSVIGMEAVIAVPVFVGALPTPTPHP
jgi:hypothetical protein